MPKANYGRLLRKLPATTLLRSTTLVLVLKIIVLVLEILVEVGVWCKRVIVVVLRTKELLTVQQPPPLIGEVRYMMNNKSIN